MADPEHIDLSQEPVDPLPDIKSALLPSLRVVFLTYDVLFEIDEQTYGKHNMPLVEWVEQDPAEAYELLRDLSLEAAEEGPDGGGEEMDAYLPHPVVEPMEICIAACTAEVIKRGNPTPEDFQKICSFIVEPADLA